MKHQRIFYPLAVVAAVLIGIAIAAYLILYEKFDVSRGEEFSDIVACDKPVAFGPNSKASCDKAFTEFTESVFVCGYITSSRKDISDISILLLRSGSERPVYVSPVRLRLSGGSFCHEVLIPLTNQSGGYTVELHYFRRRVASTTFEIR